jgi:hypothetical protein
MDKLFLASVVARERKDEITKELAIRHMLKEAESDSPRISKSKRLVLRFVFAIIILSSFVYGLIS